MNENNQALTAPEHNRHPWLFLMGLTIFALIIRVYRLGNIPAGIFRDEATNGYDAYSLLKTGKDIHGDILPFFMNHYGNEPVGGLCTPI